MCSLVFYVKDGVFNLAMLRVNKEKGCIWHGMHMAATLRSLL